MNEMITDQFLDNIKIKLKKMGILFEALMECEQCGKEICIDANIFQKCFEKDCDEYVAGCVHCLNEFYFCEKHTERIAYDCEYSQPVFKIKKAVDDLEGW